MPLGGAERHGQILEAGGFEIRTELGRLVCSEFGFADPLGRLQEASCAVALREFAAESRIRIPEPTRRGGGSAARSRRRKAAPGRCGR